MNSVILNGWLTDSIVPSRGNRQGCPLSALLFILAIEMIAVKVRETELIEGISIGHANKEVKGKIVILKTFILSRLVYTAQVITCPSVVLKRIDKLMFDFLWGSTAVRVKKSYVMQNEAAGELKMINLQNHINSIKLKWICKFIDNFRGKWKWFFEYRRN